MGSRQRCKGWCPQPHQGLGNGVALGDSAEDVDQNAFDLGVAEDNTKGLDGAVGGDAAADVEEIGGFAAVQLDDVHGRHGQTGPIDQTADVAIQRDVGKARLIGPDFVGVVFGGVAQGGDVIVPEQGVVVKIDLGIDGQDATVGGADQGVNLGQGAVVLSEYAGQPDQCLDRRFSLVGVGESERVGKAGRLKTLQSEVRMKPLANDGARVAGGYGR